MKKTVMIIGSRLLQVPVVLDARKMGHQVIVTDYNPGRNGLHYADWSA